MLLATAGPVLEASGVSPTSILGPRILIYVENNICFWPHRARLGGLWASTTSTLGPEILIYVENDK